MEATSALIWHGQGGGTGYTGTGFAQNWSVLCRALKIFTAKGKPPRIHDLRHSFAVQALKRGYLKGEDVQARKNQKSVAGGSFLRCQKLLWGVIFGILKSTLCICKGVAISLAYPLTKDGNKKRGMDIVIHLPSPALITEPKKSRE
jgi:hypothetical protein